MKLNRLRAGPRRLGGADRGLPVASPPRYGLATGRDAGETIGSAFADVADECVEILTIVAKGDVGRWLTQFEGAV